MAKQQKKVVQASPGDYIPVVVAFILSWGIGAWFFSQMPNSVAVHWGLNGEPDRFGSRFEAAFLGPIMLSLLSILFFFIGRHTNGKYMMRLAGITGCFLIAIQVIIGLNALGVLLDVTKFVILAMAALFVALGYIVPGLSQNRYGGFRNRYTLSDMRVWESTNKLGGRMLMLCGLLLVPLAFVPPLYGFIGIFVLILITVVIIPIVHSMTEYRRLQARR